MSGIYVYRARTPSPIAGSSASAHLPMNNIPLESQPARLSGPSYRNAAEQPIYNHGRPAIPANHYSQSYPTQSIWGDICINPILDYKSPHIVIYNMTLPPSTSAVPALSNAAMSIVPFFRTVPITDKELQQPACHPALSSLQILIPDLDPQPILIHGYGPHISVGDVLNYVYARMHSVMDMDQLARLTPAQKARIMDAFERRCRQAADFYKEKKDGIRLCDWLVTNTYFKGLKVRNVNDPRTWILLCGPR